MLENRQTDAELIRAVLARVDERIVPADFDDTWMTAVRANAFKPAGSRGVHILDALRRGAAWPRAILIGMTAGLMILVLAAVLNNGYVEKTEPAAGTEISRANITPLDPNLPWYGPTDDLLRVGVLRYETQLVTFSTYDPITMEIK
jgi:hypothetical protein